MSPSPPSPATANDLSVDQVGALLRDLVQPLLEVETVPLREALGRVLAHDLVSPINVPPHDNSAMDGFAFSGGQLKPEQALQMRVIGTALAGKAWSGTVGAGECLRIMTGAVLPAGLDTVVPLERVHVQDDTVTVPAGVARTGDNRRLAGEDLQVGQPALHQGQHLGPAALGLVASLGVGEVAVVRRLTVAYFSTGDEILSLGEAPREGAVFDSNRFTICGLLETLGVQVLDLGAVRDEPLALEAALRHAAAQADAIVTSGGMSMGEADHIRALMQKLGDVAFWRIAMRPGRPMAAGRIGHTQDRFAAGPPQGETAPLGGSEARAAGNVGAYLFGLPGNPVAAMVSFLLFVQPALRRLMGETAKPPVLLQARCLETLHKRPGRSEYQRGVVARQADGTLVVRSTGAQGSGLLHSMVEANGLIVLHHDQGPVATGDPLDVMMFDGLI
jgi:molybdopterin molybdotransferase